VSAAYAQLLELAELELELVRAADYEGAASAQERRAALAAQLPATPPAEAGPLLEALARVQEQVERALERDMAQAASELQAVRRGRHAVQAYTPPAPPGNGSRLVDSTG
jgi:hypothetical protein